MTHKCFAIGCKEEVRADYLCCFKHWKRVPKAMQALIWATVGVKESREVYVLAVRDSMVSVAHKEGYDAKEIEEMIEKEGMIEGLERRFDLKHG